MKTFKHKTCDKLEVGWRYKFKRADITLTVIDISECEDAFCSLNKKEESSCSGFKATFNSSDGRTISACINNHLIKDLANGYYGPST